jgi:hypothetical protein
MSVQANWARWYPRASSSKLRISVQVQVGVIMMLRALVQTPRRVLLKTTILFCFCVELQTSRSQIGAARHARSNFASKPAQTEGARSATRSLSWRVSPERLKLAEPVRKSRLSMQ